MTDKAYLSIGDVLTLLKEEFEDVTISKIRFLESQGLLDPERTPSGYRKFYEDDVERLRWILRQQREHFLPLKVIKDRLDDDTGEAGPGVPSLVPPVANAWPAGRPAAAAEPPPGPVVPDAGNPGPVAPERSPEPEVTVRPEASEASAPPEPGEAARRLGLTPASEGQAGSATLGPGPAPTVAAPPPEPSAAPSPPPAPGPTGLERNPDRSTAASVDAGLTEVARAHWPSGYDIAEPPSRGGHAPEPPSRGGHAPEPPSRGGHAPEPAYRGGHAPEPPSRGGHAPEPAYRGGHAPEPAYRVSSWAMSAGLNGVDYNVEELAAAAGLSVDQVAQLEQYGLVTGRPLAGSVYYDEEALTVARLVAGFSAFGIEARHLRMYKLAADREAGFFQQIILPLLKQRNPQARHRATETLGELSRLGQALRASLLRIALRDQA